MWSSSTALITKTQDGLVPLSLEHAFAVDKPRRALAPHMCDRDLLAMVHPK
ncbi:hypothetical protein [Sorangium atrum]|uniref:Uncharacterized protein n=1 Tax=Sorangium atrum TaxID=2995308 RepID=A0ABT5BZI5_9BACT|nr:hypothetical protein [Sorangium aterium]MDC0679576.1 hypothetical protein [Sorangium aterium]